MLKIFKTVIRPNEGTEVYQRDSKHRVTMGYDAGTISVKIEEIIAPNPNLDESLPENTPTVLRDVHETSDYVTVVEKTFTESSFIKTTDNNKCFALFKKSSAKKISYFAARPHRIVINRIRRSFFIKFFIVKTVYKVPPNRRLTPYSHIY